MAAICTLLGGIGGAVAIVQWAPWSPDQQASQPTASESIRTISTYTPTPVSISTLILTIRPSPTPKPTIRPDPTTRPILEHMFESAKDAPSYPGRDSALRIVATTAIKHGDYAMAIKAAAASPSYDARSEILAFVGRCAALERKFTHAAEAARLIPEYDARDKAVNDILAIQSGLMRAQFPYMSQECRDGIGDGQ